MNRVTIVSIAVVVLLAGGYTGASALAGRTIRTHLKAQTGAVSQLLPSATLEEKYVSGPFTTTRTVRLHMGCAQLPGPGAASQQTPLTVTWRDQIKHGPIPGGRRMAAAVIETEVLAPSAPANKGAAPAEERLLTARTVVGFDGAFESDLQMDADALELDGEKFSWTGLKARATGRLPSKDGTLQYDIASNPLLAEFAGKDSKSKLELGTLRMTGSFPFDPNAPRLLVSSNHEMQLDTLKISGTTGASSGAVKPLHLALTKWTAKGKTSLRKEMWSSTTTLSGAMDITGFAVPKLEMSGSMTRIHAPSYENLLRKLFATAMSCDATQNLDNPLALVGLLQGDFFTMLTHDPEYALGPIAIELAGQRGELSYRLGTRGIRGGDANTPLPELLQAKGFANAQVRAQLGLIDELVRIAVNVAAKDGQDAARRQVETVQAIGSTHAMIDNFVKQGYLVREGDSLRASIDTHRGQLRLNGKPFQLPALGGAPGGPDPDDDEADDQADDDDGE